jgi:hypothetical protein
MCVSGAPNRALRSVKFPAPRQLSIAMALLSNLPGGPADALASSGSGGAHGGAAKVVVARWRRHCNQVQRHSSFGCRRPASEAVLPWGHSLQPMPVWTGART